MDNNEPQTFRAGDRLLFRKHVGEIDLDKETEVDAEDDGWTLKYFFRGNESGKTKIDLTATLDSANDEFKIEVDSSTTKSWEPGIYHWIAVIEKAGDRHQIDKGTTEILPDFETLGHHDSRSHVKEELDAVRAAILNLTKFEISNYTLPDGETVTQADLQKLYDRERDLQNRYNMELERERVSNGKATGRNILVRF